MFSLAKIRAIPTQLEMVVDEGDLVMEWPECYLHLELRHSGPNDVEVYERLQRICEGGELTVQRVAEGIAHFAVFAPKALKKVVLTARGLREYAERACQLLNEKIAR